MSEPTPSAWAMEQALLLDIYCDCGCRSRTTCSESMGFIAAALDAADLRGHTRAVEEIVTWLHAEVDAALSMRMPARASTFLAAAEAIERGDHREETTK